VFGCQEIRVRVCHFLQFVSARDFENDGRNNFDLPKVPQS
jgi:hypothetical protein